MTQIKNAIFNDKNTTFAGIGMLLIAVGTLVQALFDGNPDTIPDYNTFVAEIVVALGLFSAGDGGK